MIYRGLRIVLFSPISHLPIGDFGLFLVSCCWVLFSVLLVVLGLEFVFLLFLSFSDPFNYVVLVVLSLEFIVCI